MIKNHEIKSEPPRSLKQALMSQADNEVAANQLLSMLLRENGKNKEKVAHILEEEIKKRGRQKKKMSILTIAYKKIVEEVYERDIESWEKYNLPTLNSLIVGLLISLDSSFYFLHAVVKRFPQLREIAVGNSQPFNHLGNSSFLITAIIGDAAIELLTEFKPINSVVEVLDIKRFYPYIIAALFLLLNTLVEAESESPEDWLMGVFSLIVGWKGYKSYVQSQFNKHLHSEEPPGVMGKTYQLIENFIMGPSAIAFENLKRGIKSVFQGK